MDLGVYLHGSSPYNPKTTVGQYVRDAKLYEQAGAHSLWFADHLIRTPDPSESALYETWTLIAALTRETTDIKFGTMVTPVTFRNVGLFAKMISTVDHLSTGRLIVGLGAGWYGKEHQMFGLELHEVKPRLDYLEETLQALLRLWNDDKVNFEGAHVSLADAYLNPKPLQTPHPPILVGGGGEKRTLRMVAEYAQMSNFGGDKQTIRHKLNVLKDHCDDIGRPFDEITPTTNMAAVLGGNEKEVERAVDDYRQRFVELGRKPPDKDDFADNRLVGTPEDVVNQIDELQEIGIDMINITVNDGQTQDYLPQLLQLAS